MIKNYRIAINLTVNIPERITPDLIIKAKENIVGQINVHLHQENLDMLQDIITYIINNLELHAECIYGKLLFKLASNNTNEQSHEITEPSPDIFEKNILRAAEALGPRYLKLIKQLYQSLPNEDDEAKKIPADHDHIPPDEQNILIELLRLCLVDSTISLS